jgi:uncharacterized protein (TIGR04255 family)
MTDLEANDLDFAAPPVIETVLGVQFAPISGLTSMHIGLFWKQCLESSWVKIAEAVPLPDVSESFAETPANPLQIKFAVLPMPVPRMQITHADTGRMIQLQPSRFHYNWNRVGGKYPRYRTVKEEFWRYFEKFLAFVKGEGLGEVAPNQWEVTYIDSIPKGSLWNTAEDWHQVLPGLFPSQRYPATVLLESVVGEWHYEIPPRCGRVHISVQLARVGQDPTDVLLLQSTARGPISQETSPTLIAGLDLGHRAIVDTFLAITSPEAQKAWGKK